MPAPGGDRNDHELLAAANRGDAEAFEALYRRHRERVLAWALRQGLDADAALDVLQEAFLYVASKRPRLALETPIAALLYPVVKHGCWKRIRREQRFARAVESGEIAREEASTPEPAADAEERALDKLLASLPEAQREVLLLRFVDDLALEEIGAALAIPLGTVKSRLHLAIARLREDPRTKRWFEGRV